MTSVRLKPFCFFVFVFFPQRARQLKAAAVISPSQLESTLRTRKPRVLPLSYFLMSPALIARNPISLEAHLFSSNPHHQNLQYSESVHSVKTATVVSLGTKGFSPSCSLLNQQTSGSRLDSAGGMKTSSQDLLKKNDNRLIEIEQEDF